MSIWHKAMKEGIEEGVAKGLDAVFSGPTPLLDAAIKESVGRVAAPFIAEIHRLRAENARLKSELDALRKAGA